MMDYLGYLIGFLIISSYYLGKKVGSDQMRDDVLAIIEKDVKK